MRSLSRAMEIIKTFNPNELHLSANAICLKVGIPKSTIYRILAYLTEFRLLDHDLNTGRYSIGPELYVQGSLYLSSTAMLKTAESVMMTLNDLTNEAVNLGILEEGNLTIVMKEESKHAFRFSHHIGSVIPAYAASMGKVLLSELSESEIDALYPQEQMLTLTKKTVATKTELKLELEQIRKSGIAFDKEGSYEGVEGIASVIRNERGKAVAAMSIAAPVFRINQTQEERLAQLVRLGTSLISYKLGYQGANNPVRDIEEVRSWWEKRK